MSAFTHNLGQVTYPRMERQDLTQGQLGSFKFTPTDEIRPLFSEPSSESTQQYARPHFGKGPARVLTTLTGNVCMTNNQNRCLPKLSPNRPNISFFDTHIKPDLAKSRLQLGPKVLRAAVDGSPVSPQRRSFEFDAFQPTWQADSTQLKMPSQNGVQDHLDSDHNGVPGLTHPPQRGISSDINLLHETLIRALLSEQQAHQVTKDALEIERACRIKAEAEAKKYVELNHSLAGTVSMLKSVVQHNVKKDQEAAQQRVVENFHDSVKATTGAHTLLHDAVKNLRHPRQKTTPPPMSKPGTTPNSVAAQTTTIATPVDSTHLFDFDLVQKHGSDSLRKHFLEASPEAQPKATVSASEDTNQLVPVSPQNNVKRETPNGNDDANEIVVSASSYETAVEDEIVAAETIPKPPTKSMSMPFDAHVQWNVESIFDDSRDKFKRLRYGSGVFVQYPVRYFPNKSDKNIYRTVMMDFIPNGATMKEILQTIRGGNVESIQLFGPIGRSTNTMTARVVFNYELGARGVYMRGQEPGIFIKGKRIRVWQVLEATYPRDAALERLIFNEGYTRFLVIANATKGALDKLPKKLERQMQAGFVVDISKSPDDFPVVEFTSIVECSKALNQLMNDPDFGGSCFDFEEDACNGSY